MFVLLVQEELPDWEDSRQIGRKRQWFTLDNALEQLAKHKPVQRHYLMQLRRSRKLGRHLSTATDDGEDAIFQHDDAAFLKHDDCVGGGGCDGAPRATAPEQEDGDAGGGGGGGLEVTSSLD